VLFRLAFLSWFPSRNPQTLPHRRLTHPESLVSVECASGFYGDLPEHHDQPRFLCRNLQTIFSLKLRSAMFDGAMNFHFSENVGEVSVKNRSDHAVRRWHQIRKCIATTVRQADTVVDQIRVTQHIEGKASQSSPVNQPCDEMIHCAW
jgi:hypothetical protein